MARFSLYQQSKKKKNKYKMGALVCGRQVLLASSGAKNSEKGGVAKELIRLPGDISPDFTQKNPLAGVNIDIQHVKEIQRQRRKKYQKLEFSSIIIESSKYKGKLLKRKEIISKLAEAFKTGHNTFIFTGHGVYQGAMWIQTQQNEEGQLFSIEELVKIFLQNRKSKQGLTIFLDCCYAGKMAIHLKSIQLPDDLRIVMFCSSGPNQTSSDVNNFGGLLVCWLWKQLVENKYLLDHEEKFLALKFQKNNPLRLTRQLATYQIKNNSEMRWSQLKPLQWSSDLDEQFMLKECQLI